MSADEVEAGWKGIVAGLTPDEVARVRNWASTLAQAFREQVVTTDEVREFTARSMRATAGTGDILLPGDDLMDLIASRRTD